MICWAKTNAGMGSLYRVQTEFIVLWKVGKASHINNIELGKHGRYRTTLWTYAGANTFRKGRMEDLAAHPTVKPCAMIMDAIKDCSKPNGIILDLFGGSGSTLIAAHKTKRRGYTAWVMGHDPRKRIMAISYAKELSRKHAVDFRSVVGSAWFKDIFPDFLVKSDREGELVTTKRGSSFAGLVGGSVLGRGADLIVIDDPIKGLDAALSVAERRRVTEFYDSTLYSRLNDKLSGAIVIVMQRLHQDDLVGHVLDKEEWELLTIPAIAPEDQLYRLGDGVEEVYRRKAGEILHPGREPAVWLEAARKNLGTQNFSAQYQQDPLPAEGNVIKRDWLRYYDTRPAAFERVVASWDTASTIGETSDWSVGTVWGAIGQEFYLLDVIRGRWESPELRRRIVEVATAQGVDATLIEDTELGRALSQDLRRTGQLFPFLQQARFDKTARLLAQAARFEAGQVYIPRAADWLAGYLSELLAFPAGRNDDQVDSTSQALKYLTARTPVVFELPQSVNRPQRVVRPASLLPRP